MLRYIRILLFVAAIALAAWIYLAFFNGRFWIVTDKLLSARSPAHASRVAILIPARNEADLIGRSVSSLLDQDYEGETRIFLIDDNSSDGTSAAAIEAAQQRSERLVVIAGAPLREGWSGKIWALQQAWEKAQEFAPELVLLTDADIVHEPKDLSALVAKTEDGFDFVSQMVRLHSQSFADKLLIPAFVYFFFMLYPPGWVADSRRRIAGAAGGCILLRAELLRKIGGFAPICTAVIDDCSLAKLAKGQGARLWLGLTIRAASIRPYDGVAGIVRMIARTAFDQLQHSAVLLALCLLGMALIFFAPLVLLFAPSAVLKGMAAITLIVMAVTYAPVVRFYGLAWPMAFTLPVAAAIYLLATVISALDYWRGVGGKWKGRAQDPVRL